ncbi:MULTISPECIES: hypothetical protein [Liquorilactobacillus]|uniref:hypothetical protein n=1 Tax=Liquorilactobacillus TaxID=2767888 RepID=UPI0039EAB6A9
MKTKPSVEELIEDVKPIIIRKFGTLNQQEIDGEILAWISMYRFGNSLYKEIAKKWLIKELGQ